MSGLHQVNSFQNNSESVASLVNNNSDSVHSVILPPTATTQTAPPPPSRLTAPPSPVSPTRRPPLAPHATTTTMTEQGETRAGRVEDHRKSLRAREVELLENASVASVLTSPSVDLGHVSTSESLARKQLMAELREASTLMAESHTPEAAEFWKNHVISLQARLRSLHNEESAANNNNNNNNNNSPKQQEASPRGRSPRVVEEPADTQFFSTPNYGPPKYSSEFFHPPLEPKQYNNAQQPSNYNSSQPPPQSYTPPPHQQQNYAAPPPQQQQNYTQQSNYNSQPPPQQQQQSNYNAKPDSPYNEPRRPAPPLEPAPNPSPQLPVSSLTMARSAQQRQSPQDVDRVDVVSPADLPAGYHFEAEIDGRRFLATVPFGGVSKGETFSCVMRELVPQGPSVPMGGWRDRLCDCVAFGAMHPVNINTLFCPLLSLGQIMTRLNLDVFGRPMKIRADSWSTMWSITIFWSVMNFFIYLAYNYKWSHQLSLTASDYIAVSVLNAAGILYTIYAVSATRAVVRDMYDIREYRFYDLEDNCCATFCLCATICQMHRHTSPYDKCEAHACTKTGLRDHANIDFMKPQQQQ